MQLLYRINRTGTTVVVVTHDREMVDKMRRRVIALDAGRVVRDQAAGMYADDESTREFAARVRDEMGVEDESPRTRRGRPMGRLFFFIREGLRALRRSAAPSLAAIVTVAVTVLLLGVLIPVLQTTERQDQRGPRPGRPARLPLRRRHPAARSSALQTQIQGIPHVPAGRVRLQGPGPDDPAATASRRRTSEDLDRAASRGPQPAAGLLQRHARRPRQPRAACARRSPRRARTASPTPISPVI